MRWPIATLFLATLFLVACTGNSDATPTTEVTPTLEASPTPEATATAPLAAGTIAVTTLDLRVGCILFDQSARRGPRVAGEPIELNYGITSCGRQAIGAAAGVRTEWTPVGFDGPTVTVTFREDDAGRWVASPTFPEPGMWQSDPRLGPNFIEVTGANDGLLASAPGLPLPAIPRAIAVLNPDATEVTRQFTADFGGIGLMREPDRLVFVRPRDGGQEVVAANIATGEIEPLLEAEGFLNVLAAPDGRAVAVSWTERNGRPHPLVLIDAATGARTRFEDNGGSSPDATWAPDSSALLVVGDQLRLIASDGTLLLDRTLPLEQRLSATWAPDASYVLLRFWGSPTRFERLDPVSLDTEPAFQQDGELIVGSRSGIAIAPRGGQVAVAWWEQQGEPIHVSIIPRNAPADARLSDYLVTTFELVGDFAEFGGLAWSPDEQSLAFFASGIVIHDVPSRSPAGAAEGLRVGSIVGVLDVATGNAREVATSEEFYAVSLRGPAWSADGRTLFARRFPCSACGPPTSAVDAIDVASGRLLEAFEDTSYLGPAANGAAQLLATPNGLLRTDARGNSDLLVAALGSTPFSGGYVAIEDGPIAVALPSPRNQVLAAMPDGTALALFGAPGPEVVALLDPETAIVRAPNGWTRQPLEDGAPQPYVAASTAGEKVSLALSPSGTLAVDIDYEGFAILDVTRPGAPPILTRRPVPGTEGLPPPPVPAIWSPDERRIAFINPGGASVYDLETDGEYVFSTADLGLDPDDPFTQVWSIAFTPAGELLLATTQALWSVDIDSGAITNLAEAPRPGGFFQGTLLRYSPDGTTLVAANQFGVFVLEPDATWREIAALGIPAVGGTLRWSPDSSAVAYTASASSEPKGIIVVPIDGSGAHRLVAGPFPSRILDWLPDGRIVWVTTSFGE